MKTKETTPYVTLSKSFLAKESVAANKRAFEAFHGESDEHNKDTLFWDWKNLETDTEVNFKPEDDEIEITINSNLGYFNFTIPIDLDFKMGIIKAVTKQFNKVKSMLESAK